MGREWVEICLVIARIILLGGSQCELDGGKSLCCANDLVVKFLFVPGVQITSLFMLQKSGAG